ncbi:MAG: hypothetical protein QNJ14_03410 [Woeseiaceae bacterium]|nr:hypothetical protein [Woeseiaceae bacterium]
MNKLVQVLLYGAFAIIVGYFSIAPGYRYADPGLATIKLSLSHAADRVEECVKLTPQEINERAIAGESINECARERLPLTVEVDIDGERMLQVTATPSGLWNDGPSSVYERLSVQPGTHTITARLRDSARTEGWDYEESESVTLEPGRYFTITFRAETGGFGFR